MNAVPYVTAYSYDSAGRLAGMSYPSGRTVTYAFDALGRVSEIDTTNGLPPIFRTLLIGAKMLSEGSNGTQEIHGGVQA